MSILSNKVGIKSILLILSVLFLTSLIAFFLLKSNDGFQLNDQEKLWVEQHKVIKVAGDPAFFPFDYDTKFGNHKGFSKDYLDIVSKKLGVKFEYQKCDTWSEVLQKAKSGEVELISNVEMNQERTKYLSFSESYLAMPFYIIANKSESSIKTLADLKGKKIALPKDYNIARFFRENYPEITIVDTKNDRQSLSMVNLRRIDATICDLACTSYYVQNDGLDNLMVADEINHACYMRMGVRKENQMLFHLINKALYSIDNKQRDALYDKWIDLKFDKYQFYQKAILIVSLLVLLFSGLLLFYIIWSNVLRKKVDQKTKELTLIKNNLNNMVKAKTYQLNDTIAVLEKTLEDKNRLFSIVSHDLRNSFSALVGITDLLTEKDIDISRQEQRGLLEEMKKSSVDTYQLLLNLLEWSSAKATNSEASYSVFKLDNIIFSVIRQQETLAGRKELKINYMFNDIELFSDGRKIETILRNLLSNAIKYSRVGARIWINVVQEADFVSLEVKDEGVGMARELTDVLFDVKISNSLSGTKGEKGTGIGLMLCKQFATEIGAKIEAKSQLGEGTSFIIRLPNNKLPN